MSNRGFTTIGLIFLFPVLFTLTGFVLWMVWFLGVKHQQQNICYGSLLETHERAFFLQDQILNLNPTALSLILRKKQVQVALLTAPPQMKPLWLAEKKRILMQQKRLKIQQQNLFLKLYSETRFRLAYGKVRLSRSLKKQLVFENNLQSTSLKVSARHRKLKLHISLNDTAPVYSRRVEDQQEQAMDMGWQVPMRALLPSYLKFSLPKNSLWKGRCRTHPQQRRTKWQIAIGEVKA